MAKKNRITKLRLREVSVVDDGMNQHAEVVLMKMAPTPGDVHVPGPMGGEGFKRCDDCKTPRNCGKAGGCRFNDTAVKIGKGAGASPEDEAAAWAEAQEIENTMATKTLEELTKALTDAATAIETKDGEIAELKKQLATKDGELAELKKGAGAADDDGDDVLKSLPPKVREMIEGLKKTGDEATAELTKMREKAETDEAIAKARNYGVGDAKVIGPVMMRVAKGKTTPDDVITLEKALTAAAELAKASGMFKSFGTGGGNDNPVSGLSGLELAAAELKKNNPKLSEAEAMAQATEQNPQLYGEYIAKRRAIGHAN